MGIHYQQPTLSGPVNAALDKTAVSICEVAEAMAKLVGNFKQLSLVIIQGSTISTCGTVSVFVYDDQAPSLPL